MLEKVKIVDKIEVIENGCIHVRNVTRILEEGNVISESYDRHVVVPGEDYSNEDPKVQAICQAVHTPEAIAEYQALIGNQA